MKAYLAVCVGTVKSSHEAPIVVHVAPVDGGSCFTHLEVQAPSTRNVHQLSL